MPFGISAGAAALIGSGVTAAAGLAGSAMSAGATSSAANASRAQQEMAYKIADAKLAPYYSAGTDALGQVVDLTRGGWGDYQDTMRAGFQTDPGYQFALSEGLRGVDAGAASRGMVDSGATRKAEIGYAEGLANQQYNQYASRFDNYVNRLYALAGAGQNSATQSATTALNTGTNLSNISLGQGAADANIYGNAAKGISSSVNSLFGNQDFRNWLNSGSGGSSIYPSGNVTGTQNNTGLLTGSTNVGGNTWYGGGSGAANSMLYSPTEVAAVNAWY